MELTAKEKLAWPLYAGGSAMGIVSTYALSGFWQAVAATGAALITAAAGLGLTGLRATTGGR
jgi:hypothetical protein